MIEGFKLTVSGKELKTHLAERAKYHEGRAEWYEQQKEQFSSVPTQPDWKNGTSNDPVEGLKVSGKRHREKALVFSFYAAHVDAEERYQLNDHELQQLELIANSRY